MIPGTVPKTYGYSQGTESNQDAVSFACSVFSLQVGLMKNLLPAGHRSSCAEMPNLQRLVGG